MIGKKFGFYSVGIIAALMLSACSAVPESSDLRVSDGETISGGTYTFDTVKEDVPEKEITSEKAEITPEKITDKLPETEKTEKTTETAVHNEQSEPISLSGSENSISEADSSDNMAVYTENPPQTNKTETNGTEPAVTVQAPESVSEPVSVSESEPAAETVYIPASGSVSEPDHEVSEDKTTTTVKEAPPAYTEKQTETSIAAEPDITEAKPEETEPSLTGGAYGQRFCSDSEAEFAERVFELTNLEREKEGLPKFEKMDVLKNVALTRAWELTVEYRGDHSRPDGSSCTGAFNENGIYYGGWAENIAAGQDTPEGVVEAWMNSPSHRAAILNKDYTFMGVGYYYIKDDHQSYYHFWTQEFYHY